MVLSGLNHRVSTPHRAIVGVRRLMQHGLLRRSWLLIVVGTLLPLHAQEVTLGVGAMSSPDSHQSSYAWHLDYRRWFYPSISGSVTWLNEGHVQGHHRDGLAAQLWADKRFSAGKFSLSAGLGAYHFFDTQQQMDGDSVIDRAWAVIGSVAATYYTDERWFWRLTANAIVPDENIQVHTLTVALGYRLGSEQRPLRRNPAALIEPIGSNTPENEITVFVGKTVVNASVGSWDQAVSLEYRRRLARHLAASASWLNEGDAEVLQRNGPTAQLWLIDTWRRWELGIGAGVYYSRDHKRDNAANHRRHLMSLVSPTLGYRFSHGWGARVIWHRVITDYHRDTDVFLAGVSRVW